MRKNCFLCILLMFFLLAQIIPAHAATDPADWAWLVEQVASGKTSITLPNDIEYDGGDGLSCEDMARIEGNGHELVGAVIDGGTIVFKDVRLRGTHGVRDESGGDALTVRGDGAVAALMGNTRADGGLSGPDGVTGGDGIKMTGKEQGLILNNTANATGGVGRAHGGAGIRVTGCEASVLLADNATLIGSAGVAEGGAGLVLPACGKISVSGQSAATGGAASYSGGHGLSSPRCYECDARGAITISDMAMLIGSAGQDGGTGLSVDREAAGDTADILLRGTCMLIGGDGGVGGAALRATNCLLDVEEGVLAFGGQYYETETPTVLLENCTIEGEIINSMAGEKTDVYPASNITPIITTALSKQSDRYVPEVIEDGLATYELMTKWDGLSVDYNSVSQASVNGGSLKIFIHNGTMEKRLKFQQRLMDDGSGGARLVLTASTSDEWPTLDATVAALEKLQSLGVTQLAYTCVAPVYHERILDLEALLTAIKTSEREVTRIVCGTADDAVIFYYDDNTSEYQETLMEEIARPIA